MASAASIMATSPRVSIIPSASPIVPPPYLPVRLPRLKPTLYRPPARVKIPAPSRARPSEALHRLRQQPGQLGTREHDLIPGPHRHRGAAGRAVHAHRRGVAGGGRSEEHTSELQSRVDI